MSPHVIAPCPLCGSSASLDWTAVAEYGGRAWQSVFVSCDERTGTPCDHNVSIDTDSDRIGGAAQALEAAAVAAWNATASAIQHR